MSESKEWRAVIIGTPTIRRLLAGEEVTLGDFRINLLPDDVLWNNREDTMLLFGNDAATAKRIFKARDLIGGKRDPRSITVKRAKPLGEKPASGESTVEKGPSEGK